MRPRRSDLLNLTRSGRAWWLWSKSVSANERPSRAPQRESVRWIRQRVAVAQVAITVLLVALAAEVAALAVNSDWDALVFSSPLVGIAAAWTINLERQVRNLKLCRVRTSRYGRTSSRSDRY